MSRYAAVSRRALLKRGAGLGALALIPGIACGASDAEVFAGERAARADLAEPSPTAIPAEPQPVTTAEPLTAPASPDPTVPPPTPVPPTPVPPSTALPVGAQAIISFSYTQAAGGKNLPPYIAVWIEDMTGDLVATVALWFQQDRRGENWLPDLKRWFTNHTASGAATDIDVLSSATRLPGAYSVMWDGTVFGGQPAIPGDYFVCIESSRERGPYSLIREPVVFDGALVELALADVGELTNAAVAISV